MPGHFFRLGTATVNRASTQRRLWFAAILLTLAATAIAYLPGLHGPFIFDDTTSITDNAALHLAGFALPDLMRAAFSSHAGLLFRPISMLSFAFNYTFFGNGVFSFKLTNVVVHLINALLILWLTRRLLSNCRRQFQFDWTDRRIGWVAIVVTAAWALHPLNLTAVLYVVQRMTSLAALFTLAGMLAYVYGRERQLADKTGWPLVWLLTPLFGVFGVLSKEDAALLPLYLLVIEWLIFGFRSADGERAKSIVVYYLAGLVLPGLIGSAYLLQHHILAAYAGRPFTLGERVLTEFRVVFLYIKWTFYPDIRELALYHDDIAISTGLLHPVTTLLSLLALCGLFAIAIWQRKTRPLLSFGILWFFAGQMMESTVLPLLIAFEHRNYLPDYGLLLAFFSLLLLPTAAGARVFRPSLRWTVAALTLPVLFSATFVRAGEWGNLLSFAYYEAHHHPHSENALYVLGQAYSDLALAGQLKNPEVALQALSNAAVQSQNIMPDVAMMIVAAKMKMPVNPAWEQHAQRLLLSHSVGVQATQSLNALVNCLVKNCQVLAPTAGQLLKAALQSAKRHAPNADLWVIYGNYLTFTDRPLAEIIAAMSEAAQLAPKVPQYQINLAQCYIAAGNFSAAEASIAVVSRLNKFGSQDHNLAMLKRQLSDARTANQQGPLIGPPNPPASQQHGVVPDGSTRPPGPVAAPRPQYVPSTVIHVGPAP